jgi:hypothetical protein
MKLMIDIDGNINPNHINKAVRNDKQRGNNND